MTFTNTAEVISAPQSLWPKPGSSVPTISFGGSSVGVTYASQSCNYTIVGNRLFFDAEVTLSSKGTSVGEFRLNLNIPTEYSALASRPASVFATGISSGSGANALISQVLNGSRSVLLYEVVSGSATAYTDVNLQNASTIRVSGSWRFA